MIRRALRRLPVLAWMLLAMLLASKAAHAQRDTFLERYGKDPSRFERDSRFGEKQGRMPNEPGDFDYYALVLSWSPTHCAGVSGRDDDLQCNRRDGRRYAFVLHGLWPQYEKGYPENCRMRRKPFVPQPLIEQMLDIMPSTGLVIHEFRKHGTCSGLDAAGYYELARRLFRAIKVPEEFKNPMEQRFIAPDELEGAFLAANPQLKPDMISIACGGSGPKLKELRICFSKEGLPRACGSNEVQARLCAARRMTMPPVRSAKYEPETAEERKKALDDVRGALPRARTLPQ